MNSTNMRQSPDDRLQPSPHCMTRPDGSRLTYCVWQPLEAASKALVILDGWTDGDGIQGWPAALGLKDVAVFARCEHGADASVTHVAEPQDLTARVADIDRWIGHLSQMHDKRVEDFVVLASGIDAMLLAVWAHDYAPRIRAMVLAAPSFPIRSSQRAAWTDREPRWSGRKHRRMLRYTAERIVADAAAIRVPTLLLESGRGAGADRSPQRIFFERLQTPLKRRTVCQGLGHNLEDESGRQAVTDEVRRFMADIFRGLPERRPLLLADRYGYTQDEYERLKTPLPWRSWRGLRYRLLKTGIRMLALLSPGIRLAVRTGFDSGQMLDYVYENRACGWPPFRWIDRIFLDNIGWKACRARKALTEQMLREAIGRVADAGQAVRIVDIAAGPGRYVLEIIRVLPGIEISALLRDNTAANLEDGRKLAEQFGLTQVTFQLGDALDESSLAEIQPAPNVAVACGIYQLIGDNDLILRSLRGLAAALRGGGYLVYTSLPWDPGLEMSARALVNRMGEAAIRRRRTQEELDDLVRAAGFEKLTMAIDEFGMSTVSLARKP